MHKISQPEELSLFESMQNDPPRSFVLHFSVETSGRSGKIGENKLPFGAEVIIILSNAQLFDTAAAVSHVIMVNIMKV